MKKAGWSNPIGNLQQQKKQDKRKPVRKRKQILVAHTFLLVTAAHARSAEPMKPAESFRSGCILTELEYTCRNCGRPTLTLLFR